MTSASPPADEPQVGIAVRRRPMTPRARRVLALLTGRETPPTAAAQAGPVDDAFTSTRVQLLNQSPELVNC